MRILITVVFIVAGFAAGFYAGMKYRNQQILDEPEVFMKEYGAELKSTAKEKYEKIKQVLLED